MNYKLLLKIILSLLILIVIFFLLTVLFFLIYRRDNGSFNSLFWSSKSLYKTYSSLSSEGGCSGSSIYYKLGQTIQDVNFFNFLFLMAIGISIGVMIYFLIKFLTNPVSFSYENPEQATYRRQREILRQEEEKQEAILKEKEDTEFNSLDKKTDRELFLALKKRKI